MSSGWLTGSVAIVTGGGSGLGRSVVKRFLEEGAHVGVLERSPAKVEDLKREFGSAIIALPGNVVDYSDNERIVHATCERFGRLDTFIANAGVFDFFEPLARMDGVAISSAFDELFNVNVKGALLGAKAALGPLVKSDGSLIVTLSCAAFHAGGGGVLYTASKHALHGLVRQLAHEFAPRVRVNGVAPGAMRTELTGLAVTGTDHRKLGDTVGFDERASKQTPLGGVYAPDDYCGPYVLLASRANARPITGVVINTDGGLGVRGIKQLAGGLDL